MNLSSLEYICFFRYPPRAIASHRYLGAPEYDLCVRSYERLAKEACIGFTAFPDGPGGPSV